MSRLQPKPEPKSKPKPAARSRTASALVRAVLAELDGDAAQASAKAFAEGAAADVAGDELPELSTPELARNLADFWRFAERRRGRGPQTRTAPVQGARAGGLDRLEIVQDDAPFLVDSVMGEIADQGLSVRAMFHPIVTVQRDRSGVRGDTGTARRESMIQVILEPIGADREQMLVEGVDATLKDVRAAVDDFPAMLDLMGRAGVPLMAAR